MVFIYDFSSPIPERRECQLLMVRETAKLAKDMGAKKIRLFAAWIGVPTHEQVALAREFMANIINK